MRRRSKSNLCSFESPREIQPVKIKCVGKKVKFWHIRFIMKIFILFLSRPGSRWTTASLTDSSSMKLSHLNIASEFDTDSSLSYCNNSTTDLVKLKLAIRVKPAPQEYSIRSGLPGNLNQVSFYCENSKIANFKNCDI